MLHEEFRRLALISLLTWVTDVNKNVRNLHSLTVCPSFKFSKAGREKM